MFLKGILWGLGAVLVYFIISWIIASIKATKDPDVKIATALGIPILRYRKYKEWYDEHERLMKQYGIESKEANEYFSSFIDQIQNKNEWRRYQNFRYEQFQMEQMNK